MNIRIKHPCSLHLTNENRQFCGTEPSPNEHETFFTPSKRVRQLAASPFKTTPYRFFPNQKITFTKIVGLLSKLPKPIKEPLRRPAADFKESGVFNMTVTVTERDDAHISHESIADGIQIWDVRQQDQLVGMFHHESDAQRYAAELAELEAKKAASNSQ
jgi:hypothetical protein